MSTTMASRGSEDGLKALDPQKLERLEARLTSSSNGSNKYGVTSVGFDSPSNPVRNISNNSNMKMHVDSSRSNGSVNSSISRTVSGIEKSPAFVPDSPPPRMAELHHQRIDETSTDSSSLRHMVRNSKRKLPPEFPPRTPLRTVEEVPAKKQNVVAETDESGFSKEDDQAIMNAVLFHRTAASWKTLSEKLGRTEDLLKARYRVIIAKAAYVGEEERRKLTQDLTGSNNSMSRGGLSNLSNGESNHSNHLSPYRGGMPETNNVSSSSSSNSSNIQNSNHNNNSSTSRRSMASPSVSSTSSLKNALKNQPQIKKFFISKNQGEKNKRMRVTGPSTPMPAPKPTNDMNHGDLNESNGNNSNGLMMMMMRSPSFDGGMVSSSSSTATTAVNNTNNNNNNTMTLVSATTTSTTAASSSKNDSKALKRAMTEKDKEISYLKGQLGGKREELLRERNLREILSAENKDLQEKIVEAQQVHEDHKSRVAKVMEDVLRQMDRQILKNQQKQLIEDSYRLGKIAVQKHGFGPRAKLSEYWEDGEAFRKLRYEQVDLLQRREELEKKRKQVAKSIRQRKSGGQASSAGTYAELEDAEAEEAVKAEMANLKRKEQELADMRTKLDIEKVYHYKLLQKLREESASRFNRQPVLNNRYLLRELLGKGGFSEVWKGYDLIQLRDVAVKIHELNSTWSETKKENYLRHATREYKIHLNLVHPKIVQLFDVFEIDSNSFATVLEYCEGENLEVHLKCRKTLPEREARAILLQILAGLRYLSSGGDLQDDGLQQNHTGEGSSGSHEDIISSSAIMAQQAPSQRPCIIHYDLKPGNILFDGCGGVKITDFGLSKIMEPADAESTGIELTSQGAGTYWYLPPECFQIGGAPPKISSKVDVWSTGVIFYQMLYGARPFGEGLTQDKLLQNQTMLKATQVAFPEKPAVSNEAKTFIRRCLTYSQEYRPDVKTICLDPYLKQKKV